MKMPNTASLIFDLRRAADELLCQEAELDEGASVLGGLLMIACRALDMLSTEIRVLQSLHTDHDAAPPDEADGIPGERAPAPRAKASHRHKFDAAGICTTCGKVKSAGGRKPAAAADDAPPVDARTLPLRHVGRPADDFADGTMGSSGVTRR